MGDWVGESTEGYVTLAVKFARMPELLTSLRRELPAKVAAAPSGNGALYTRAVEQAYRTMWQEYCRAPA